MEENVIKINNLLKNEVNKYIKDPENINLINHAIEFATKAHDGQKRKSGEPYIIHLLNVGYILATLRMGPKAIAAGILHDVIEDCDYSEEQLIEIFGEEITNLVQSVTKIGKIEFADEKEYQAVNHRKIFIAMAKDVRVIVIKLVDRLHNMRTLNFMPREKQIRIAAETLEVYAPIAHRLGISEIKNELEDLSFNYLEPEKYKEIAKLVERRKNERDAQVRNMIANISKLLDSHNIKYRIFGRSKHLYSINKKMVTKNKRFEEILDLLAIRIVTTDAADPDDNTNCYEILGYIHANYSGIPGRFKDYISIPKFNMYESLHTTVIGEEGSIFEIQIRNERMDAVAEKGIAAHWKYKEGTSENKQEQIEEKLAWFKDFTSMSTEVDDNAKEYMDLLTKDIFEANVYCMTPKGRVLTLPNGSTPIDFAYRIHTEIGHQTVGATINGVMLPLNTPIKTGDVISIKTSKQSHGPSEDWLKIVKSNHAKNKIRSFFQRQEIEKRAADIKKAEDMLTDELKKRGFNPETYNDIKKIEAVMGSFTYTSYHDLMYAVATKKVPLSTLVEKLTKQKTNLLQDNKLVTKIFNKNTTKKREVSKTGVIVPGVDSMMVTLSSCCNPVYGDDIVGYVSKGQGVKVHRSNCPNIAKEEKRIIQVEWDENFENKKYSANLIIQSTDRNYLLSDIITVVSQCKANIVHIDSKVNDDKITVTTKLETSIQDLNHLDILISNLCKVSCVLNIERVIL